MTRLQGHIEVARDAEHSWPIERARRDPWAQDEALDDPARPADYHRHALRPVLTDAEVTAYDAIFRERYRAVLEGAAPWGATAAAAAALQLDEPLRHDPRPLHPAPAPIDDAVLADLADNWLPTLGMLAPERVLGPLAWQDPPRRLRLLAHAVLGLSPLIPPSIRPIGRALRSEPVPPLSIRGAALAVCRAPAMLWAVEGRTAEGAWLRPLLPMHPPHAPTQPVRGVPEAAVAVVGRAVQGPGGPFLALGLPLPSAPHPRLVQRRLLLEYQRLRRHDRRLTWEDLLRDRAEVLYRCTCEALFLSRVAPGAPPAGPAALADCFARSWPAAAAEA